MSFNLPYQLSPFSKKENAREQYESFSRFEKPEVKKFIDSLKTKDPFNKHIDYIYDSESRRAENNYYSPGEVIKSKKPKTNNPIKQVDPDAPGTPGKSGYEPPVVKKELDAAGIKIYDGIRRKNDSLLKSGMTQEQINAKRLKEHLEKKKKKKEQQ